jgi:hypothetical protein
VKKFHVVVVVLDLGTPSELSDDIVRSEDSGEAIVNGILEEKIESFGGVAKAQ